jgi:hypothetical protein
MATDSPASLGFEADIKPMFRERDRQTMIGVAKFDLWSYDDVSDHADAILARVRDGSMPCDAAWAEEQVDQLQRWIDGGKAR